MARRRSERREHGVLLGAHDADHLTRLHRLPLRDRELADTAGPMRMDLVLHLHRLDDADHLAGLYLVTLVDLDREDGSLHRRDDGILSGRAGTGAPGTLPAAARELDEAGLGPEHAHLEAPALH